MASDDVDRERAKLDAVRDETEHAKSSFLEFAQRKSDYLRSLDADSFPAVKSELENSEIQLAKKKALVAELQRKLDEWCTVVSQEKLPLLTVSLESELGERQIVLDGYENKRAEMDRLRMVLDRKLRIIDELEKAFPLAAKVKTTKGIDEFAFIYDVVFTRNRDLAHDLQLATQELTQLELENRELQSQLHG
jgi:hypothetical protein